MMQSKMEHCYFLAGIADVSLGKENDDDEVMRANPLAEASL